MFNGVFESLQKASITSSLRHSTITPALLKDASEKDLAKEVIKTWQSDAGRLIRAFLEQAHVVALVLEQDGVASVAG